MSNWRRQQLLEDFRDAQKECTCENNGDLCNPCQAREAIGMSKTPRAAWAAVAYQKESIAKYEENLMSTRSITKFLGYSGTVQAIVYRHSDGYPEGAGRDINQFLNECKKLKDPRLDDASYLAAKYVVFLANMFNNSFQFIEENGKREMKKVQHASRLDFISVGIVDATFDDFAYSYTIDCKKLDAKGKPEVICYDSEGVVTPIPRGKNNWQ